MALSPENDLDGYSDPNTPACECADWGMMGCLSTCPREIYLTKKRELSRRIKHDSAPHHLEAGRTPDSPQVIGRTGGTDGPLSEGEASPCTIVIAGGEATADRERFGREADSRKADEAVTGTFTIRAGESVLGSWTHAIDPNGKRAIFDTQFIKDNGGSISVNRDGPIIVECPEVRKQFFEPKLGEPSVESDFAGFEVKAPPLAQHLDPGLEQEFFNSKLGEPHATGGYVDPGPYTNGGPYFGIDFGKCPTISREEWASRVRAEVLPLTASHVDRHLAKIESARASWWAGAGRAHIKAVREYFAGLTAEQVAAFGRILAGTASDADISLAFTQTVRFPRPESSFPSWNRNYGWQPPVQGPSVHITDFRQAADSFGSGTGDLQEGEKPTR